MLPIKDEEKFLRTITKESSTSNSSFRVYYGENSVAVPFVWEAKPGTPKHSKQNLSNLIEEKNYIPSLTPPPCYYSTQVKKMHCAKKSSKAFQGLFPKMMHKRETSSVSLSSSSTLSSWSSSSRMSVSDMTPKSPQESQSSSQSLSRSRSRSRSRSLSNPGSLVDFVGNDQEVDEEEEEMRIPRSVFCFGLMSSRKIRNFPAVDQKL